MEESDARYPIGGRRVGARRDALRVAFAPVRRAAGG